ncbi:Multisite-specific tRNA:(cytosine-C(5))-methyltransferase trm4b [Rhodotorula toruloides]|nr:Multisite-specific tRNA:(cytosine-C(5))-methyltransferase trm4b [Rhodotorula toruloides]
MGKRSNKPAKERTLSRNNAQGGNWKVIEQTNPDFFSYYKTQKIVPEDEWDDFVKALREPLPTTFRLTSSRPTAHALNEHIKQVYVPFLTGLEYEGKQLQPPKPIEYPNQLAWQLPVPKSALRKNDHMRKFQHFLVYETDAGNISRQEAVSMIPPLLLDVQPGHTALDMCAAPGSKSVQILEALHGPALHAGAGDKDVSPQGLLIANDSDAKRCHLLVHQSLHRVPGTGMMVTNHDATQLPSLRLPKDDKVLDGRLKFTPEDEREMAKTPKGRERAQKEYDGMLFDRILADVPCSGDGTLRKNLGIWNDWTVGNGIGLHTLQLRILLRGIQLLKPGGRLVYSTCSMNPMENESVISAALSLCPEMSILPVPDALPGLKRRPGLTSWDVLDNSLKAAPRSGSEDAKAPDAPEQPEEGVAVEQDNDKSTVDGSKGKGKGRKGKKADGPNNVDKKGQRKAWTETLWPRGDEKEKGLEHCLRLYPHLQDTGAFFVCVLVKKGDAQPAQVEMRKEEQKMEVEEGAKAAEKRERSATPTPVDGQPEAKKARREQEQAPVEVVAKEDDEKKEHIMGGGRPFNEEPYIYLPGLEDEQIQVIKDFFGISDSFPVSDLLVRNAAGAALRSVYLTSDLTRKLLLSNAYTRMRLISCGVKLFTRQDSSKDGTYRCKWRLNSEGLEVVRPFLDERRILKVGNETLRQVMEEVSVKFEDLKEEDVRERVKAMEPGSAILRVEKAKGKDIEMEEDLYLAFWISKTSCNLMVEKLEKSALSLRLYAEDVTPHSKAKVAAAKSAADTPATTDAETAAATDAVEEEDGEKVEAEEQVAKEEAGEESLATTRAVSRRAASSVRETEEPVSTVTTAQPNLRAMSAPPPATKRAASWFGRSRSSTPQPDAVPQLTKQLEDTEIDSPGEAVESGEDETITADDLGVADELQGDTETEQGSSGHPSQDDLRQGLVERADLAQMLEPIGNLEHWTYIDRPDYFGALAKENMDEMEKMLAVLRWMSPDLEAFQLDPRRALLLLLRRTSTRRHPLPTVHIDENPHPDIVACAGRGSNNTTAAAALKASPSTSSLISLANSAKPKTSLEMTNGNAVGSSAASTKSTRSNFSAAPSSSAASGSGPTESRNARVVIINEQTSHHPPISHFLVEARVDTADPAVKRTVRLRGADQLSAKFTAGANVKIYPGPHNKGLFLDLPDGEEFHITHPTAAVAGIVRAAPYATIADICTVTCRLPEDKQPGGEKQKRLRAIIQYQEESWITRPRFLLEGIVYESFVNEAASDPTAMVDDGSDKRFSKIKQVPKDRIVGTLEGNWRGEIRWKKVGESSSVPLVDLLPLNVVPKAVAPLEEQGPMETRKVWASVVDALNKKDYSTASKEKQRIEQEQRDKAEERKKKGEVYRPRFFEPEPDNVADWDGRPVLSAEGKAALERNFEADYSTSPSTA